jgi:hypothetical protein
MGNPRRMKYLVLAYFFALSAALSAQDGEWVPFSSWDSLAQSVGKAGGLLDEGWKTPGGVGVYSPPWLGLMLQAAGVNSTTLKNLGFLGGNVPVFSAAFDPFLGPFLPVVAGKPRVNLGPRIAPGTKWSGKFYAEACYDPILVTSSRHSDYVQVSFGFRW